MILTHTKVFFGGEKGHKISDFELKKKIHQISTTGCSW